MECLSKDVEVRKKKKNGNLRMKPSNNQNTLPWMVQELYDADTEMPIKLAKSEKKKD